jgi:2-C-methyl-D-erythritol 4-phosphate cytidylyltransferase
LDCYAVIVAGGSSKRMNSDIPKQFVKIKGIPVFVYSIMAFLRCIPAQNICIVVPENYQGDVAELLKADKIMQKCKVVKGGSERFYSVKAGLECIPEGGFVAVHDAARPMLKVSTILQGFELLNSYPAAIPLVPLKDSIRQITENGSKAVKRSEYFAVQTPQFFRTSLLKRAYSAEYTPDFTDDATVFEHMNMKVHHFEGDQANTKLTSPEDFYLAENLL